jgi:hypothetical protein
MIRFKKIAMLFVLIAAFLFTAFGQAAATDKTLKVGKVSGAKDATVSVPVGVNDPTGVGGLTFTLTYDPAVFEFAGLTQGGKVITDGSNTTYTEDELKNSLFYQENHTTAGRLLVAAAAADGLGTAETVLLNARFRILGGNGEYPIGIVRTIIQNVAAGYATPTMLPVLVGTTAKNASGLYDSTDFPVFPAILVGGSITVNADKFTINGSVAYGSEAVATGSTVVLKRSTPNGWVVDSQTVVDGSGNYSFASKVAGTYQVFVTSNDPNYYNANSATFDISANYTVTKIVLPAPQRLAGSVTLNGKYVPGLKVMVMNGATVVGVYLVNADGTFQTAPLPPLPAGSSYTLKAVYGSLECGITAGTANAWTATLYSIKGAIAGLSASAKATVTASSLSAKLQKTIEVTADGSGNVAEYAIEDLPPTVSPSGYVVSVTSAGLPVTYYNATTDAAAATKVVADANKTGINFDFTSITKGTITGTISNSPIANIAVYAFETTNPALTAANADAVGAYSFTLAPGIYEIFVIKPNGKIFYYSSSGTTQSEAEATLVNLAAGGNPSGININLLECENTLTGKVAFERADGDPAVGVLITATSDRGNGIALTGQDGSYTLSGLCDATYLVEMNPLNSKFAVQRQEVAVPGTTGLEPFIIDKGSILSGKVAAEDGTGIGNAMIYLIDQATGMLVNGRMYFSSSDTATLGNYAIADIDGGVYSINVTHPDYKSYSESDVEITTDLVKPTVTLTKGAYFNITVTDGDNSTPLPGALAIVIKAAAGSMPIYALANSSGNCKIYGLDKSTAYTILVQKSGFERKSQSVTTDGSADENVVPITLNRPAAKFTLNGTVTSDCTDNPPVAGAYVVVSSEHAASGKGFFSTVLTNSTGGYIFADIPQADDYRLVVVPGGDLRTVVFTGLDYLDTNNAANPYNVSISCGSSISGTITAGSSPIYVFLYKDDKFVAYTKAASGGAYEFKGLSGGGYKVMATSRGYSPKWNGNVTTKGAATAVNAGVTVDINL